MVIRIFCLALAACASACAHHARTEPCAAASTAHAPAVVRPVAGFSPEANAQLAAFFGRTRDVPGRKVAVFDGDGTVLGQVPHYLADECLYRHAKAHPDRRPELVKEMSKQSNVSMPYVQNRIRYLAGMTLEQVRELGDRCFAELYSDKIYAPMKDLLALLGEHGFEVWIITASPEALYQQFLARTFDLPLTHVVGVKSVVRGGVVTDEMVHPIPQDEGKKAAIETFVQVQPLLAGGNSRGDKEMIEFAKELSLIVNPDEHVAPGQDKSIADYAKEHGWLVVRIRDVAGDAFPSASSRDFGVRLNATHDVP